MRDASRPTRLVLILAALALVAIGAVGGLLWSRSTSPPPVSTERPAQDGLSRAMTFSPPGSAKP